MSRDWFEGWKGQYRRITRWKNRANEALKNNDDGDEIYDFIYAFFQSSYHLKDWLIADGVATTDDIKILFKSCVELRLCKDICNATKHLQYDRSSILKKPRISREWDPFNKKATGYYLYTDKKIPIQELMNKCVIAWDEFLESKKLNHAYKEK